ncbi:MAG: flagellar hook-associated protein FlgL [Proteobacteria bacterium]|nr:flagellar hook-associated protein FlgL [Pseudomonadota bacterium]
MRIATQTIFDTAKFQLSNISQELSKANEIVSTGKRITDISDDPLGVTQALSIKSTVSNIDQVKRNISMGNSWLTAAESALSQTQEVITEVKALCVQMASDTTRPEQRASASLTVQNMLEEIISLANTEVNGRYIFAGTKTDTTPFSQNGTYNGDNNIFAVKIGKDSTVAVGSDGDAVFSNILATLGGLKTDLESNDVGSIGNAMNSLNDCIDDFSTQISDVGSKTLRMEVKERILDNLKISNAERLSEIEDADMAEAIMNLSSIELTYKAALSSSAQIMTLSLIDYLE